MVYNAGLQPPYRPRIGQLATPLETRWREMQERAWREMRREDYAKSGIGSMMMSESGIDFITDQIADSKARKAEAEQLSPSMLAALAKWDEERRATLALLEHFEVVRKAAVMVSDQVDVLFMGLDLTALKPLPISRASLAETSEWLNKQTAAVVEEETLKLRAWRPVFQSRIAHLEKVVGYASQDAGVKALQILRVMISSRKQSGISARKRSSKPGKVK